MADRVLSIEIGYSLTKVCEIERSNSRAPKILNSFVITTPEGFVNDGIVEPSDEFANRMRTMLDAKKIKTKKAIFTIASNRIVNKEVTIPFVKETKIKDVVRANISEYFPVDPVQYMFAHSIIGVVKDKDDTSKSTGYKLQVLACPKPLINGYEKLAKLCSLELNAVDYNGNSVYQAAKEECREGVQLLAKVDERNTLLMVLDNGVIAFNRTIPYGIDEAVNTLSRTTQLGEVDTYEKALELARRKRVILSNFNGDAMATEDEDDENEAEAIRNDKKSVTDAFRNLAAGIARVIDYYDSNHQDSKIEKVMITGIGSDFSGLSSLLNHEFNIKVRNLTKLAGIDTVKAFDGATFGEYVGVIGASIAPVSFYPDHDDKEKGSSSGPLSGVRSTLFAVLIFLLGIIAAIVMVVISVFPYLKEKKLNDEYNARIAELQPSYDIYLQYLEKENDYDYLTNVNNAGHNRNDELVSLIDYMEKEMPTDFLLNSMESDNEKVTMDITVNTKEEVAYSYDKFTECDIFSYADLESVSYVVTDLGEYLYEFTIDLYYAPYVDESTEETEGN